MAVRMRMTTINIVLQLYSVSECLFHKRVRLVKSVQSINHLVCLESPRRYVEMKMLRLVMGQLGLSLDDKTLQCWRKKLLKTLSISRSLLLIRDVYSTKVPFGDLVDWYKAISCLYLRFCLQIRSKVVTNCTDDQIKSLTRTNVILRKLICQTPTNRSEGQCFLQFDTLFVHRSTGVVSPKTELS